MSEKLYRQESIKHLIFIHEISSQEELIKFLSNEGITVTQATLSRDLRELKVSKFPGEKGNYVYKLAEPEHKEISTYSESIAFTGNLGILRTQPGFATRIGIEVDRTPNDYILGTIAGDDTLFIALKENFLKENIIQIINKIVPNIKIIS